MWRGASERLDVDWRSAHLCDKLKVKLTRTTVGHRTIGLRCVAKVQLGKKMIAGHYSGTRIYANRQGA